MSTAVAVWAARTRPFAAVIGLISLAACSDSVATLPGLPAVPVPDSIRLVKDVGSPANVVERGLSDCARGRTPAGETACLKDALVAAHMDVAALTRLVPGCRTGQVCHYRFTTTDRVGFVPLTQTRYSVRWQADFDLRKPVKAIGDVPITVTVV